MKKAIFITIICTLTLFSKGVDDAVYALDKKDYKKAFEIFSKYAKYKNSFAQFNLGMIYYDGLGKKKI